MSARTRRLARERGAQKQRARTRRTRFWAAGGIAALAMGAVAVAGLLGGAPSPSGTADAAWFAPQPADVVYGKADAPVTVVEYASLTCSHCARFHAEALDGFVKGWVDTGKARLVFRPYPLDGAALAGASAIACMPEPDRPKAVSRLYPTVGQWSATSDVAEAAARAAGLSAKALGRTLACLKAGGAEERVLEGIRQAQGRIASTPSFAVGGSVYSGFLSAAALGRIADGN